MVDSQKTGNSNCRWSGKVIVALQCETLLCLIESITIRI